MGKTKIKTVEENLIDDKELSSSNSAEPSSTTPAASEASEHVLEDVALSEDNNKTDTKNKKGKKPKRGQKIRSKKYLKVVEEVEKTKNYPLAEAVEIAKKLSYSKFAGTIEIHINTNVKNIRGLVSLPFVSGKKLKIAAFGKNADSSEADIIIDDEKFADLEKGRVNFDVLIVTPDIMPKIARLAKVLGPRGLMPNPKNGTITDDLKKAVSELQGGKIEYKSESKANLIHLGIGKTDQVSEEIYQNTKILLSTIGKSKIKKAVLSPTMGPAVRIDLSSI